MQILSRKTLILLCGVVFVIMLFAGCEEQSTSDTRQSRLIAIENTQLTELLDKSQAELDKRRQLLKQCQQEKTLEVKKAKDNAESLIAFVMEQNTKLIEENKSLKAQLAELQNKAQ